MGMAQEPVSGAPAGTGDRLSEDALTGRSRGQLMLQGLSKRRCVRVVMEVGYDAVAWISGLLLAARATGDLAGVELTRFDLWSAAAGICALVAGVGLLAGRYRGRGLAR